MTALATYLTRHAISRADFAKRAETSRSYVSELASGTRTPSLRMAVHIERLTNGEVKAASLLVHERNNGGVASSDQDSQSASPKGVTPRQKAEGAA